MIIQSIARETAERGLQTDSRRELRAGNRIEAILDEPKSQCRSKRSRDRRRGGENSPRKTIPDFAIPMIIDFLVNQAEIKGSIAIGIVPGKTAIKEGHLADHRRGIDEIPVLPTTIDDR